MSDSELQKRFDFLCAQIGPAQHKCNITYLDWQEACREWRDLARERHEVWDKLLGDSLTEGLPVDYKTLLNSHKTG